jgi:hypothetical protein
LIGRTDPKARRFSSIRRTCSRRRNRKVEQRESRVRELVDGVIGAAAHAHRQRRVGPALVVDERVVGQPLHQAVARAGPVEQVSRKLEVPGREHLADAMAGAPQISG